MKDIIPVYPDISPSLSVGILKYSLLILVFFFFLMQIAGWLKQSFGYLLAMLLSRRMAVHQAKFRPEHVDVYYRKHFGALSPLSYLG